MRIILTFMVLLQLNAVAQKLEYIDNTTVVIGDFIGYDALGYGYFISANNSLTKIKAIESAQYQNVAFGRIARVDITNPLNLVIHYPDFNSVAMLDNQLNEVRSITFSDISDDLIVSATGFASQNRLWLYDNISQRIGLYSYLGNQLNFITQPLPAPKYYQTDVNTFQWINDQWQWFSCDVYGKITAVATVPAHDTIRFISGQTAIYSFDGKLYFFTAADGKSEQIAIDAKTVKSFQYHDQILSIFTANGFTNYKIITP